MNKYLLIGTAVVLVSVVIISYFLIKKDRNISPQTTIVATSTIDTMTFDFPYKKGETMPIKLQDGLAKVVTDEVTYNVTLENAVAHKDSDQQTRYISGTLVNCMEFSIGATRCFTYLFTALENAQGMSKPVLVVE